MKLSNAPAELYIFIVMIKYAGFMKKIKKHHLFSDVRIKRETFPHESKNYIFAIIFSIVINISLKLLLKGSLSPIL